MASSFGISKNRAQLRQMTQRAVAPLNERLETDGIDEDVVGDLMLAPLDELYPDPNNPRWAGDPEPTWEQIQNPDLVMALDIRKELRCIHELSASMAPPNKQQTPIECFRGPRGYHIITGGRRYWALRLLKSQQAVIVLKAEAPRRLRRTQLIENVQRRSLTVRAQLFNLVQMLEEERSLDTPVADAVDLAERVGYSKEMGYRWWRILKGPEDVQAAIRSRAITNMMAAVHIAKLSNAKSRAQLIKNPGQLANLKDEDEDFQAESSPAKAPPRAASKKRAGRIRKFVTFGRTEKLPVVRRLILAVDPQGDYKDVDWENLEVVTKVWRNLLEKLERELMTTG